MTAKKKGMKRQEPSRSWVEHGEKLAKRKSLNQWAIADWLRDGMEKFETSAVYDRAEELTGMTRASLYQFKLTAELLPISTRVKKLSFGHHRLVAKKIFTEAKRKELLRYALTHKPKKLTVAQFAEHVAKECGRIAKLEKDDDRMENTPTSADQAAGKLVEFCRHFFDRLENHEGVRTLMHSGPPGDRQVVRELKALAEELNRIVEELQFRWQDHDVAYYHQEERADAVGAGGQ